MSDGLTEALNGTYFSSKSKFNNNIPQRKKLNFWRRLINRIKRK